MQAPWLAGCADLSQDLGLLQTFQKLRSWLNQKLKQEKITNYFTKVVIINYEPWVDRQMCKINHHWPYTLHRTHYTVKSHAKH